MMVYRVCVPIARPDGAKPATPDVEQYKPRWCATQADCRALVRQEAPLVRSGMCIEKIGLDEDKASLVDILNGHLPEGAWVESVWRGTSRGGLKEGAGL